MKRKSSTIEANTRNYLKFISNPNIINLRKSRNQIYYNPIKENKSSNINNISSLNHSNNNVNIQIKQLNQKELNFNIKKNPTEKDIFKKRDELIKNNAKFRRSDIPNPSYFIEIGEEIMKLNNEAMDYNIREAEKKLYKKLTNKYDDISLSPEKIQNINYYNLGESFLDVNPLINKGSYFQNELKNAKKYNGKKKSDLMII